MKMLSFLLFIAGTALVIGALLWPWLKRVPNQTMLQLIENFRKADRRADTIAFPEMSPKEIVFMEQSRLAGLHWRYHKFKIMQWSLTFTSFAMIFTALILQGVMQGGWSLMNWLQTLGASMAVAFVFHWAPIGWMTVLAAQRKTLVLAEISKFAHRLSICVSDKADLREMIARAGRPLRLLRPHIQKLSAQWGNDQREAILAFKDGVGIAEVYPLVNAFAAISRAKPMDVTRLLVEHSRSIDASLEAELNKRIENAPIWISFYIMIPFMVCLLLFVYPWVLTVLNQLAVSFTAG